MTPRTFASDELDRAENAFGIHFPPDLRQLLSNRGIHDGYDWAGDPEPIRNALRWPFEGLLFDIEENGLWWPEWGKRPEDAYARAAVLSEVLLAAPRLIPLSGHRYLPQEPGGTGNPVFSVYQSDILVYGADLYDWMRVELDRTFKSEPRSEQRKIEFWSIAVERNGDPRFRIPQG